MIFSRKAQEEIVGFVVIVLIVAVIAVIFLGISLRNNPAQTKESIDLRRFVDSSLVYTTDCAIGYEPNYAKLNDLIKKCYSNPLDTCLDGRSACIALNDTLKAILNSSWQASSDSKINAYEFKGVYAINASASEEDVKEIVKITNGNCTSNIYTEGSSFFSVSPGTITCSFKVCYASV